MCLWCQGRAALSASVVRPSVQCARQVEPEKCQEPQCGFVWLDLMPIEEDIGKAYLTYFTHGANEQENGVHGKNGHLSVPGYKTCGFELIKMCDSWTGNSTVPTPTKRAC